MIATSASLVLASGPSQLPTLLNTGGSSVASVCIISAGWQEFEGEYEDMNFRPASDAVDLRLYARAEALFQRHPSLREAHGRRQMLVQEAERYYQLRLGFAMDAALALWDEAGNSALLHHNRLDCVRALRTLDRQHLRRMQEIYKAFFKQIDEQCARAIARQREAIAKELERHPIVLLAGGHVAVLLNRLRLFDLAPILRQRRLVAWGAGAMLCGARVLLFDDSGALGPRHPAFYDLGLGLAPSVVALPAARRRLALSLAPRMGLLARRTAPAQALLLEGEAQVFVDNGRVGGGHGLHRLSASGRVVKVRDQ